MTASGTIPLKDVWAMLDVCAPGYTKKARDHNWLVSYDGMAYPRLPRGAHGRRENPEIQMGHVRQMVRYLGIQVCAGAQIEGLGI